MPNPAVIKAAAALLADERTRKGIGWIIVAVLSPVIVLLALLCSLSAGSGHNASVVELCFNGGTLPPDTPAEYAAYIEDMRSSFGLLDGFIEDINGMTEEGNSLQQYILGASYKELVEHLREQDVPYDAGKLWNKNMVARILENRKYTGQPGWPLIVDTDTFEHANEKRSSKVSPSQQTDAQKVLRRLSGGGSIEVEQAVLHLLNLLIAEPQQIIAPQPMPPGLNRVSELRSALDHELEQQPINEDAAKHLAMELASAQYEEIGSQEYETERLRRLFQRQSPMQNLDAELLRNAVNRIYVHGKKVKIRLKNGQTVEGRA